MSRFTNATALAPTPTRARNADKVASKSKAPDAVTGELGPGYLYKDKSALFLLSVTNFTGQNTFYESGSTRDDRFISLIQKVSKSDPEFVAQMLGWLRSEGNIRTAAIIGAIEYGRTVSGTITQGALTPRNVLVSVLQRADEPSEALGYYLAKYGKKTPKWFRRAIGDAAKKLYNEFSVQKWDSKAAKVRVGDVIQLSQVDTHDSEYKAQVFQFAMDRRYGETDLEKYPALKSLRTRAEVDAVPQAQRAAYLKGNAEKIQEAGYTWETLSGWLGGPLTANFWEALIPNMGYMALIRNLRNFAKAGISVEVAQAVAKRISDREEVEKSRQLPLRFLSAYRVLQPDTDSRYYYGYSSSSAEPIDKKYEKIWAPALAEALNISLASVPKLSGETVIMVDISSSMSSRMSDKSTVTYYENAVAFGVALSLANPNSTLYAYDTSAKEIRLVRGGNILDNIASFKQQAPLGGGTATVSMAQRLLQANPSATRLVIVTDEQTTHGGGGWYGSYTSLDKVVPTEVTCVTYNLAGYEVGQAPAGRDNFHTVAGLTDAGFQTLSLLDSTGSGNWPWEK